MATTLTQAQRAILSEACTFAETTVREIIAQEEHDDVELSKALTDTPIQAWVIEKAKCLIVFRTDKTGCFLGKTSGTGVMIARLPSHSPMLIRWSAPLFLTMEWTSCGMCFGRQHTATFAVTTTTAAQAALLSPAGHHVRGLECSLVLGSSLQAADGIPSAIGDANTMNTVAMTKVTGWMLDMGFASGLIKVDAAKNKAVYGSATPVEILGGQRVPPPAEFQRFYTEMSLIVHGVEKTSGVGPSRVSASLERFSTGYDPDRHIVMPTGEVLPEDDDEDGGTTAAATN